MLDNSQLKELAPEEALMGHIGVLHPPDYTRRPAKLLDCETLSFWPSGLDPMDNQRVADWLLAQGEWSGKRAGWKNYAIGLSDAVMRPGAWAWIVKRGMDLTLVLPGIILILPIMLMAAILIKASSPMEPILFRQFRPGYLCKPYKMLKFRTMTSNGNTESPKDDAGRITFIGRLLRRTSIDELPQLFNVLFGQMSLVGPRPQLLTYLTRYNKESLYRHAVLPGIVGENQVYSRNDCTWKMRMNDDLNYVKNRTIRRDLFLAFGGLVVALRGRNTKANGTASMDEMASGT